ncbi:MAG TPA: signal peptidase I [Chthoniobacterales bacterium]|nr:signal peptidase I [Chthoniobacterales bacterium]
MFTPRYVKHSKLLVRHARKFLRYKRDIMDTETYDAIAGDIWRLRAGLKQRDKKQIESRAEELDAKLHQLMPVTWESHWRENCEVILVAIVVAVGIRSYFLQPFKIPTGSMQPTLNGIIGHPMTAPPPNILQQVAEFILRGRNYISVVSREDDEVLQIQRQKFFFFFTWSRIICEHQKFLVYCPPEQLGSDFRVSPGIRYRRGEVIARGAVDTGDQVFVDKFSYNFVKPHRGDVFVFRTRNIPDIGDQTQFYIKRLAGLPGDRLRIEPPRLYVDEKVAEGYGFERVMSAKDGYRGYGPGHLVLSDPHKEFQVPAHTYFAMGDNSYNSFDSRWWGPVPERNLVGRGLFVYWPFIPHWGIVR